MAADTKGQTSFFNIIGGESLPDLIAEDRESLGYLCVYSINEHVVRINSSEKSIYVMMQGIDHDRLTLREGTGLGEGVQSLTFDLKNRLDPHKSADRGCRRRDPSALFQIFQA